MLKNRLHPYEAGWLTFLVNSRLATQAEAREAMNRIAQEAIDEIERRRAERRLNRKGKRKD